MNILNFQSLNGCAFSNYTRKATDAVTTLQ